MVKIQGHEVGKTGMGMMGLTLQPGKVPVETAIEVLKAALEQGANLWNAGEFYGSPESNSMHLLNKYFTKYPEDADKVVLSVKGATAPDLSAFYGDEEHVRKSVENCVALLDGKKKIDIFCCARVDPKVPIEDTMRVLDTLVKEGKIGGINLSEVSSNSIKRAAKITKIAFVEVEFSLFSTEILQNDVAKTCGELGIPIVAYSPLSRGFLGGNVRSRADLPEGDFRLHLPRFSEEAFPANVALVDEVKALADKKQVTIGQIALAWVRSFSGKSGLPGIIPIPGSSSPKRVEENTKDVQLTKEEVDELNDFVEKCEVSGGRYPARVEAFSFA